MEKRRGKNDGWRRYVERKGAKDTVMGKKGENQEVGRRRVRSRQKRVIAAGKKPVGEATGGLEMG